MDILKIISDLNYNSAISLISFLSIIAGGVFAICKWYKNMRIKQADYIKSLIDMKNKKEILQVFAQIDYNRPWYDYTFHGNQMELKFDFTLTYFDYICYLNSTKIFNKKTFSLFQYQIDSIVKNEQVQDYFYNLYHYSVDNGLAISFPFLLDYAKKHKFIDKWFYCKNNDKYHKYLFK